jgi:hypothetical protein
MFQARAPILAIAPCPQIPAGHSNMRSIKPSPGGEVKALDPADYRPVSITKSISITGVEGADIDSNGTGAIAINGFGGPPLTVNLANLIIQNVGADRSLSVGVAAIPDGLVTVTHCTVRGYGHGIASPIGTTFLIVDTIVTNNGIGINATSDGLSNFELNHVTASRNRVAGVAILSANVTAVDTVANKNGTGFSVGQGRLFLAHSTVVGNGAGIDIRALGLAVSSGDIHIRANGTDVRGGTLTRVGTQ